MSITIHSECLYFNSEITNVKFKEFGNFINLCIIYYYDKGKIYYVFFLNIDTKFDYLLILT